MPEHEQKQVHFVPETINKSLSTPPKTSQIWSRHWNQVNSYPPHRNQVNFDHPHKSQINLISQQESSLSSILNTEIKLISTTHTNNKSISMTTLKLNAFRPAYLNQVILDHPHKT